MHITADNIQVSSTGVEDLYSASEMSDGERFIFYILGQVLSANENSVLIFDEPELHIHKSIMSNLWDKIEKLRPDCAFLVITHDIEFAATRVAKKYVIRNCVLKTRNAWPIELAWNIMEVPDSKFDEKTIALILGSRKPILFVEGATTSLDIETYRCCYPEWTIISKGSCKDVIQAVSSLQKLNTDMPLLNIQCAGIVDRDTREQSEISYLDSLNIKVLPVSEIENIFSFDSIAKEVLKIEGFINDELHQKQEQFKTKIIEYIKKDLSGANLDKFVIEKIRRRIDTYLKNIDLSNTNSNHEIKSKLTSEMSNLANIKINEWISEIRNEIETCLNNNDINGLLRIYENKGLLAQTASILRNTRKPDFESWLMRQLKLSDSNLLLAIKQILPTLRN